MFIYDTGNKINKKYPYLYETHVHSKESSACAVDTAVDMAKAHKQAGYSGMIITNHNWGGNTCVDRSLSWCSWLDKFYEPYFLSRQWGDKNDFQVFYGYEAGYDGTEFLIYGVSIEWMKSHPELKDATVREQFELIHSGGGIVIHAHPFREAYYIKEVRLFPEYVDGIEALNATHSSVYSTDTDIRRVYNDKAIEYAQKLNLPMTAGSDTHSTVMFGGGMAFDTKLKSIDDFVLRIKSRSDYMITDGLIRMDGTGRDLN